MKMMSRGKMYALIAVVLVLGTVWTWVNRLPSAAVTGNEQRIAPRVSFTAPDISLKAVTGEAYDLRALKGNVVLVNFWATWCGPCRAEMPAIEQVYQSRREQGFVVLAVDQQEDDASVKSFAQQLGLTFPLLMDRDATVARLYHVSALPTTFFVDRKGVVRDMAIGGPLTRAAIESKIDALLTEEGL